MLKLGGIASEQQLLNQTRQVQQHAIATMPLDTISCSTILYATLLYDLQRYYSDNVAIKYEMQRYYAAK